jgi:hypothetical protein
MESHREILFVVAMICVAGCCKEGEEPVPAAPGVSATPAATTVVAEPRVEVTPTATVRTAWDAGKITSDGGTFGAPPALVGTKGTGAQPTTKEPAPEGTTFGGPPTLATSRKTPAATTTQPTSTTTPFGAPPKLP